MRVTKTMLDSIRPGGALTVQCDVIEKIRAQSYITQRRAVTGINYATSYDRQAELLTITRPNENPREQ